MAERTAVDPALTVKSETPRSSDRPLRVVPAPPASVPQRDVPPLPARGAGGTGQPSLERLRRELEVTREEIRHLHEMTLELPDIFEDKFRQRLRATLRQQRLLLAENASLKRKLLELGPAASQGPRSPLLLPPARSEPIEPLQSQARPGLLRYLRHALVAFGGNRASATPKDGEPTRDGLAGPKRK